MQRKFGRLLAIAGLLFIAITTLVPLPRQAAAVAATPLWCLVCGDHGGVDVVVNVLLFIPFALGLRLLGWSAAAVVTAGAVMSLAIESLQVGAIPGRDASVSDLLTNTLGSFIGATLGTRLVSLLNPTRKQAIRLILLAGIVWLGVQAGTAFLLRPWVPSGPLRGEWGRVLPGRAPFDGTVTSAFVSGSPVSDGSMLVDSVHAPLAQGGIHVELGLVSGQSGSDWSPVFELMGSHGPVLAVEAVGTDLAFQPPTRSYSLRLRGPALRLPKALVSTPGKPLQLVAGERRDTLWAAWTTADIRQRSFQALSPSFGWSLVIPFDYAYGPEIRLLTGLWIAGLLAPTGYWSARSGGDRYRLSLALAALLVAGLGVIPMLTGYPPVHWSEWLAGATGLGAGWASHRAAAYFGGRCDSPSIRESC